MKSIFITEPQRILHCQHRPVPALVFERHTDLGHPSLIPAVLDKLKEHELLSLALKEPRQALLVHCKPVLHFLPFTSATHSQLPVATAPAADRPVHINE